MAGLLSDVLPFLYSQGDRAKRYVGGLLNDPMGSAEQTAGGLLDAHREQQGLLAQAFAEPKRPLRVTNDAALAQAAQNMLYGPLGMAPAGITAWHGSPHIFDKFDSSKIGTGEGAQAYGHGLYLAESPGVAEQYQKTLGFRGFDMGQEAQRRGLPINAGARGEISRQAATQRTPEEAAKYVQYANAASRDIPIDKLAQFISDYREGSKGALYKVDLPDSAVAKMLDWDAALSNQPPAVREALKNAGIADGSNFSGGLSGRELYKRARNGAPAKLPLRQVDDEIFAAQRLRAAGIPGIRYLDGGSRGAGAGSSNFVVFPGEENMLKILERNGQQVR
jgi:hypothetical protein